MSGPVVTVDNIEELRTLTDLQGMVIVKGFYALGDGGGGNFIWNSESLDTDNNGTIIKPNKLINIKGRWIRQFFEEINVRWFGARGDTKGVMGDYRGTVEVSITTNTTGTLIAEKPVFVPEDKNKIIVMWDSNAVEKPLATPSKPYAITISEFVDEYTVKFTMDFKVEFDGLTTRKIDNICFAWGTNDTDAIQAAWNATEGVYRLIFPTGIYCVGFSKKNKFGLTSNSMPSAYLEGIGKVTIVSPNSLGNIVKGYAENINEIINFGEKCGLASITNIIFQGLSTIDAGIVRYSEGSHTPLPSRFNIFGQWEKYNHRAGIHYQGTDSIICKNVQVSNMPYAGLLIDKGTGQSLIEDSYFHGNGLYNIQAVPGNRIVVTVLEKSVKILKPGEGGSIKLIHTRIEDSISVAWGYIAYGIDIGGCDLTAIDCDFINNVGCGVGNNDANPSTMTFDNCRFAFGKNHGKLLFPMTFESVKVEAKTDKVEFLPFPDTFQGQGGYNIYIPGVFWSEPKVLPYGAEPPPITIKGIAKQAVVLRIVCTLPGELGEWKFKYSTDGGIPEKEMLSSASIDLMSSVDSSDTGLKLNIEEFKNKALGKKFKATVGDLWIADNTYTSFDLNRIDRSTNSVGTVQKADTSSNPDNKSLTWIQNGTSILLSVDATCQHFSCTNCFFKGSAASSRQISAILIKGHEYDFNTYKKSLESLESQRVVKIIGNTFDTLDVIVVVYLRILNSKEIKIQSNVFLDSPFTQSIVQDPLPTPFDKIKTFNKKAIAKVIHLSGNTYIDSGPVNLTSGGLITINDERVIYTGKSYYPSIPSISPVPTTPPIPYVPSNPTAQFFTSGQHFKISTRLGRVGRVIRRNNTISGQSPDKLYLPSTTSRGLTIAYPTCWSWHDGDREEIDVFPPFSKFTYSYIYFGYGFNASTRAAETGLTIDALSSDGIADQFQAGAEIFMRYWDLIEKKFKAVTWGGGFPSVALAAVDRTKKVIGEMCARTALPADVTVKNGDVFTPFYYGGRICIKPGTFYTCAAKATTSVGNPTIAVDNVDVLYSNIKISIDGVKFPTSADQKSTKIINVDKSGLSIEVSDAPDKRVDNAQVSYVLPHASTSRGNYMIKITDDVWTLCPQQLIEIAGVTFTSPNAVSVKFTEIVDVIGNEGYGGSIIVRDAPDQTVKDAQVSFVTPKLILHDKIPTTGDAGGPP